MVREIRVYHAPILSALASAVPDGYTKNGMRRCLTLVFGAFIMMALDIPSNAGGDILMTELSIAARPRPLCRMPLVAARLQMRFRAEVREYTARLTRIWRSFRGNRKKMLPRFVDLFQSGARR